MLKISEMLLGMQISTTEEDQVSEGRLSDENNEDDDEDEHDELDDQVEEPPVAPNHYQNTIE